MAKVAVFGAGSWGTAFSLVLADAGNEVTLWARREELCAEINEQHTNSTYLADIVLPPSVGATHDPEQASAAAAQEGVDYFCVGPTWATPTKPGRPAAGLDLVRHAAALKTQRPWFAIGGIDEHNLDEVLEAGATRVVVVRAITEAADPRAAAAALRARL